MKTNYIKFNFLTALLLSACLLTACGSDGKQTNGQNDPSASSEADQTADQSVKDDVISYLPLEEGDVSPDFTATLTNGTEFTLSDQQGKVVLLNFWATWCSPCVREMPAFEKLYAEYGEDVAILAVNCMESVDIVKAFQEENEYTFPIACDEEGDIIMKYPSQGIPYTLVIDGEGVIQKIYVGAADADTQYQEYKEAIEAVSEGK